MIEKALMAAFIISAAGTPMARVIGRRFRLLDVPNERSSHAIPAPRNGGYAIVAGIAGSFAIAFGDLDSQLLVIGIAALLIAALGAIDDLRPVREVHKFLVQCGVASMLVLFAGLVIGSIDIVIAELHLLWCAVPFTLLWLVGYTNAFNFMDGINGIAATHAVISGSVLAVLFFHQGDVTGAMVGAAIAGAAAGFLPWNLPSGSIFMGDVGSVTLGLLIASLAVRYVVFSEGDFLRVILPMMPFILDTAVTLFRRIVKRERFFSAHRSHFYQRLNQLGWSHTAVTGLWTLLSAAGAASALMWLRLTDGGRVGAASLVVLMHVVVFVSIHLKERERSEP